MTDEHEHKWSLSPLGTGTEDCTVEGCGYTRSRRPAATGEEELRLQAAEEGFRSGATEIAKHLEKLADEEENLVRAATVRAKAFRAAAQHARLIAKGRSG